MTNEKAALCSQKTRGKQDEVIRTTAHTVLMMMAPLIGLHLNQLLVAALTFRCSCIVLNMDGVSLFEV